jgi:hypothetical protein
MLRKFFFATRLTLSGAIANDQSLIDLFDERGWSATIEEIRRRENPSDANEDAAERDISDERGADIREDGDDDRMYEQIPSQIGDEWVAKNPVDYFKGDDGNYWTKINHSLFTSMFIDSKQVGTHGGKNVFSIIGLSGLPLFHVEGSKRWALDSPKLDDPRHPGHGRQQKRPRQTDLCWNCRRRGHQSSECREPKRRHAKH